MKTDCCRNHEWHFISLCLQWKALLMPKVVKLCTTSPPLSVINTMLSLSKLLATLAFLPRLSYWDIFSAKVLCWCHVPGCHESTLLDTVSRSRCEPHAFNPKPGVCLLLHTSPNLLTIEIRRHTQVIKKGFCPSKPMCSPCKLFYSSDMS